MAKMNSDLAPFVSLFDTLHRTVQEFARWRAKTRGNALSLIGELKHNCNHIMLMKRNVPEAAIVAELRHKVYDRLSSSGFRFNTLRRTRISNYPSIQGTRLKSWVGKSTKELVINIYDKIKAVKTIAKHVPGHGVLIRVRLINIQDRILLLLRHTKGR